MVGFVPGSPLADMPDMVSPSDLDVSEPDEQDASPILRMRDETAQMTRAMRLWFFISLVIIVKSRA